MESFSDQAVIAIENVRLFDEVQAKTRDLTEALVYQTGSEHILRVIASSPTDVEPVLKAIVERPLGSLTSAEAPLIVRNRQPGPAQFHKAITAAKTLPEHSRRQSKQWLIAHGYHGLDDGDL